MGQRRVVADGSTPAGTYSPAVVAGGLVFVSGLVGTGADGNLVGTDVQSQTKRVFERLKATLEAAGSSIEQLVTINVYLSRASDFDAMNTAYRESISDKPPARTTVVADLTGGALVEMSAVALPNGAGRETMLPAGWMKSPRPYSYIVRTGDLVFLSGLVSRRGTDDQVVVGSAKEQTKTILDNAATLLRTAGLTLEDVVAARVFITDDLYFEDMNEVYRTYFPRKPPARATAVVGLMGVDSKIEITLIASVSPKTALGPQVAPTLPLSTAVRTGSLTFLSGVLGNTDANAGDLPAQTREVLTRIGRTLNAEGLAMSDVVDSTVYMTDVTQHAKMNDVYKEFFLTEPPARTTVGTRLVSKGGLVEILMVAVK